MYEVEGIYINIEINSKDSKNSKDKERGEVYVREENNRCKMELRK